MFRGEGFIPVHVALLESEVVSQSSQDQQGGTLGTLRGVVEVAANSASVHSEGNFEPGVPNPNESVISYGGAKRVLKILGVRNRELDDKNILDTFKLFVRNRKHLTEVKAQLEEAEQEQKAPRRRIVNSIIEGIKGAIGVFWKKLGIGYRKSVPLHHEADSYEESFLQKEVTFLQEQVEALRRLLKHGLEARQIRILDAIERLRLDNESIRSLVETPEGREFLSSLSVEEFALFWRLFLPGPALFHVTRQGWRAGVNDQIREFGASRNYKLDTAAESILREGALLPALAIEFGKTPSDIVNNIFEKAKSMDGGLTIQNVWKVFNALLNHPFLLRSMPWDRTAVHFSLAYPIIGSYGGEASNDIVVMVPASLAISPSPSGDFLDNRGNYTFGTGMKQDFRDIPEGPEGVKWNDVIIWGCCGNSKHLGEVPLGMGIVFLPENLIVDPDTGSQYVIKDGQRIPDDRLFTTLYGIIEDILDNRSGEHTDKDLGSLLEAISAYREKYSELDYSERQGYKQSMGFQLTKFLQANYKDLGLPEYMKEGNAMLEGLANDVIAIVDEYIDNHRSSGSQSIDYNRLKEDLKHSIENRGLGFKFVNEENGGISSVEYWQRLIEESGKDVRVVWYDASEGVGKAIEDFMKKFGLNRRNEYTKAFEDATLGFSPIEHNSMPPKTLAFWENVVDKFAARLGHEFNIKRETLGELKKELKRALEQNSLEAHLNIPNIEDIID